MLTTWCNTVLHWFVSALFSVCHLNYSWSFSSPWFNSVKSIKILCCKSTLITAYVFRRLWMENMNEWEKTQEKQHRELHSHTRSGRHCSASLKEMWCAYALRKSHGLINRSLNFTNFCFTCKYRINNVWKISRLHVNL